MNTIDEISSFHNNEQYTEKSDADTKLKYYNNHKMEEAYCNICKEKYMKIRRSRHMNSVKHLNNMRK